MLSELSRIADAPLRLAIRVAQTNPPSTFDIDIPANLPGQKPGEDLGSIIANVIKYGLGIAGALAVLFIVVGGIYYITAQGDTERLEKAKKTIRNSIIGAVFILLSLVIVITIDAALTGAK